MEDYPRSVTVSRRFRDEVLVRGDVSGSTWSNSAGQSGFDVPRCGRDKAWAISTTFWQCCRCDHQSSATAGTVFPGYTEALEDVVPCHVVRDEPEERSDTGFPESDWGGQLSDGLGLVA